MSRDTGGPAFPMQDTQAINAYASAKVADVIGTNERDRVYLLARAEAIGGMTLRDYFASQALAGGLEQGVENDMNAGWWHPAGKIADRAYAIADAMLKARKM